MYSNQKNTTNSYQGNPMNCSGNASTMQCNTAGCNYMNQNTCNGLQPIVMPSELQVRRCYDFVEQPVICPVECRTINNIVPVPCYYRTYTHTSCNNF